MKDIKEYAFVKEKKNIVPYLFAKQHSILPLADEGNYIIAASSEKEVFESKKELKLMLNKEIKIIYFPKALLDEAIELCYRQKEEETRKFFKDLKNRSSSEDEEEGYDLLEQSEKQNPVIKMLNAIIREAIQQDSSDVHFEPIENGLNIRYRIDGVLQKRHSPPLEFKSQLITRIKVMAKLDIAEHRLPQDGRIKLKMGGREIDFRVSTIPVVYGERVVLRILDRGNVVLGLDKIGMSLKVLANFKRQIAYPEGIVLVTGPTGSGKTTTLYSAISELSSSEINIMTIEDPVEYKLSSIAQIGVNPKINLNFATGLRHILRQDPDVIMVGEIRDSETASIAIQAALTGHLVLSTLHTNDAPSAITRLADMGMESYLLSSSIVGVLAQRLVRKICPLCKGKGCDNCFATGYKGRHGIYELMDVTSAIKKQINLNVDSEIIRKTAIEEGMIELKTSGLELIREGITTREEVLRAVRDYDSF